MEDERSTLKYVEECIENEGMWYCFDSYHDFREVKDEKFHTLREEFLSAGQNLRDYVEGKE